MTRNIIRYFATATLISLGALSLCAQNSAVYSTVPDEIDLGEWGTSKAETYDVAVKLDSRYFKGDKLKSFTFNMVSTANFSGCKGWVAKELVVNGSNEVSVDVTPEAKSISVTLPDGYTIGNEGAYVGVTFTIDKRESDADRYPVETSYGEDPVGLGMWVHSPRTYTRWTNIYPNITQVPSVTLSFTDVDENSVGIEIPAEINAVTGSECLLTTTMTNYGCRPVESVTLSYSIGGEARSVEQTLPRPMGEVFLSSFPVTFTLPANDISGESLFKAEITAVNGRDNTRAGDIKSAAYYGVSHSPLHRPILEEYSSTGCGNCPRGEIGLSKMRELHGDNFVGVTYHCSDIMTILDDNGLPNPAPAQPTSWLSRMTETDPYFGNMPLSSKLLGINDLWQAKAAEFTPAEINVTSRWTDETQSALEVTADFSFVKNYRGADFRMVYMLVADGLTGDDEQWEQGNYYSGQANIWPEEFNWLVESPRFIKGYVYENVVIYTTAVHGIAGSIPADINADDSMQHSTTIQLADANNLRGQNLVQHKDKLRVVALIVDATDGHAVNAAQTTPVSSSISAVDTDAVTVVKSEYYDMQGRLIDPESARGIAIRLDTHSDGSVSACKVSLR